MQQQKYDVNHQQIQQTLDAFGAIKTLRPEDDAYIASKLNSITTQANAMGGNLANQSITDQFLGKIKSAAQDPFILNAIEQTKKKAAVDAQVAELKKKDPNLVNDKNYRDMLDLGGYTDYMSGKADKLGTLTYNPFVDVTTNLHKKAADYSKERGLKDEYLGTENGTFETVDKFGNKVTEKEIQQYLYSNISDTEKTQMQIDARANYKYMPQADFNKVILADTQDQNNVLKDGLAKLKAEAASKSESDRAQYTNLIGETQRKITENESKIASGNFDKSEMYGYHAKNVITGIAANYDVDRVTKIERNDLPFEIMKFEKETMLKEQELALKKTAAEQAQTSSLGTATTIPTPTEEIQDTGLNVIRKNVHSTDAALDAYLKQTNPDGYNSMSPNDQWTYKINLQFNKPTIKGANATLKTLVDDFSSAQSSYATIINKAKPKLSEVTRENYNNLIGGRDLNVSNLASTMPLTASLLKNKRTFDNLSREEQLGVVSEFAANNLQYNSEIKGDVKTVYEKIIDANKAELAKLNSPKAKEVGKIIAGSTGKEGTGVLSTMGSRILGAAGVVIGIPLNEALSRASYGINELFGGTDYARSQQKYRNEVTKGILDYRNKAVAADQRLATDLFGGEDTNISELESRDLNKAGKLGVTDSFNAFNSALKADIDKSTGSFMENQKQTKAFSFSTDDKAQKATALALRGALVANGAAVDDGTKDFTVARSGNQFKVSYMNKKGDELITTTIPTLPDAVAGMIDTSAQNWNNNPNNPNIKLNPVELHQYTDPKTRDTEMNAMLENMPFTREQRIAILTNPGTTAFATIPEVRDRVKQVYSNAFYEQNKGQIENILNTKYVAKPTVEGGAFYFKIDYVDNGEMRTQYFPNPLGATKDDYAFYLQYNEAMAKVRDMRIKALTQK